MGGAALSHPAPCAPAQSAAGAGAGLLVLALRRLAHRAPLGAEGLAGLQKESQAIGRQREGHPVAAQVAARDARALRGAWSSDAMGCAAAEMRARRGRSDWRDGAANIGGAAVR